MRVYVSCLYLIPNEVTKSIFDAIGLKIIYSFQTIYFSLTNGNLIYQICNIMNNNNNKIEYILKKWKLFNGYCNTLVEI